jgi:heme/copper-type cytochrome/quinol oxidase subunit 3
MRRHEEDSRLAVAHAHATDAHDAHWTSTGLNNRKMLFWAFLGSECMFFGSLIATYLVYRGRDQVGPHPHEILDIPFTTLSAFVLLMSSLTMVLALAAIQRGNQRGGRLWLGATALLGLAFVGGQVYEFTHFFHKGLGLSTNLFGSTFFVLTGFHGTHVSVGILWLLTLFVMASKGRLGPEKALDVEIAGLYWHFVDVVWIAIFTLVYLIQ